MADDKRRYTDDVHADITTRLREICLGLPDAYEEKAWAGTRWRVRTKTFAHVLGVEQSGGERFVTMTFWAAAEDVEMLQHAGHPFYLLGWGRDAMGMVIDDSTDWAEVQELVTESFCVRAEEAGGARRPSRRWMIEQSRPETFKETR